MLKFWRNNLLVTGFVFLTMAGTSSLFELKLFDAFDPVGQALRDFELTDYAFSNLRPDPNVDERIILVNIGNLNRLEVAQQISIISKYGPKVIGIDSFFNCEGGLYDTLNCPQLLDTLSNIFLASAIEEAGNVVLVSKLLQSDMLVKKKAIDVYDSIEYSDPVFSEHATNAYANLVTDALYQEDVKICRSFIPTVKVGQEDFYAFSVATAMKFDPEKTKKFLRRSNEEEIINYRGNFEIQQIKLKNIDKDEAASSGFTGMFTALDVPDIMNENFDSTLFKDKIVLMGYLGSYFGDPSWSDKFFTPLNKKVAGRANPDMFGLVVHANIIAMILNEDYLEALGDFESFAIAFIACLLTVALLKVVDDSWEIWYDGVSVIIQVIIILLTSGIVVYSFTNWDLKLDLEYTLAATAFAGPCYDFFKSFRKTIDKWFT
jgi:CHASE2 domain-containing sensor protein